MSQFLGYFFPKLSHKVVPVGTAMENHQLAWVHQQTIELVNGEFHERSEDPETLLDVSEKKFQPRDYLWCLVIVVLFFTMLFFAMTCAQVIANLG